MGADWLKWRERNGITDGIDDEIINGILFDAPSELCQYTAR